MPQFRRSIFIFRRDLRLEDNSALMAALSNSSEVIPAFIFDPIQIKNNSFRSDNCLQFMLESLHDLKGQLSDRGGELYIFQGPPAEVIAKLIEQEKVDAVFVNRDYTPYSIKRDQAMADVCRRLNVTFNSHADYLLNEPEDIRKPDGGIYTIYTPFLRRSLDRPVRTPKSNTAQNYYQKKIKSADDQVLEKVLAKKNLSIAMAGGRREALKILKGLKSLKNYDQDRNIPALNNTTRLSAHHKFGTCSIREVYQSIYKAFGPSHTLIKELYWRDFFTHIGFHFPHVLGQPFHKKFQAIQWKNDKNKFQAWSQGQTGFPIVDAGMRELNATGFMHNRVRMITASFLVKDLHIDWQWGEKYFAQQLIDYDPLVNNGNWQWAASTGCDAQPYFRIFNPWLQQERFDPECVYIKRWVAELKDLSSKAIHGLSKDSHFFIANYPAPIVDHSVESVRAKAMYQHC